MSLDTLVPDTPTLVPVCASHSAPRVRQVDIPSGLGVGREGLSLPHLPLGQLCFWV